MSAATRRASLALRFLLAVVGLGVVAYLVRDAGAAQVLRILWQAGPWLPAILALEVSQLACDYGALATILGADWKKIPGWSLVRSASAAYAMMILLPAGRAAGEVTRATILSRYVGVSRAAATSVNLQAAYLSANGMLSIVAWAVVTSLFGAGSVLSLLLVGNVVFQAVISSGLIAILWDARVGRWLNRLRSRWLRNADEFAPREHVERTLPWRAALVCSVARLAQVLQYGIILHAVGGSAGIGSAFVAHGIHLVGTTLGDFLPNQVGVIDGAYRAFAPVLGFRDEPARALSIALLARIGQLVCASVCIVLFALARRDREPVIGSLPRRDRAKREPADANVRS